jgi:hypothetical protein
VAQQALEQGYQSDWAKKQIPSRRAKNEFYTRLGRQVEPGPIDAAKVKAIIDGLLR